MQMWAKIKAVIKPVGKFIHDAGAVAFGESFVKETTKTATDHVRGIVLDAEGKRNQLFERLLAIHPDGDNILAWHKKTNASLSKEQRLIVDGRAIPEYKFVQLLASWTPKTHPRKIDDFLRLINTLTEPEFCSYLALKWNNVLSQQIENNFGWLKIKKNREAMADEKQVSKWLVDAKKKGGEFLDTVSKWSKKQVVDFSRNINQATEKIERYNFIQGDL